MSKRTKKSVQISQEIVEAAEAIAAIKKENVEAITEQFLQNYVMENMSVLLNKVKQMNGKDEPVSSDARPQNQECRPRLNCEAR